MGLFMACDFVEHIGYTNLKDEWDMLIGYMLQFALDKNSEVRQASVYGLGAVAQATPVE